MYPGNTGREEPRFGMLLSGDFGLGFEHLEKMNRNCCYC